MSKKSEHNNLNEEPDLSADPTKPVRTGRKIFKDPIDPETRPVKTSKKLMEKSSSVSDDQTLTVATEDAPVSEGKPKKIRHGKWVWLGILILLVIAAIGAGVGYFSALKMRNTQEISQKIELATTQYMMAEQDVSNGKLDMAQKRLEYVLSIYPEYPGLTEKLAEVMLANAANSQQDPNPQPTAQIVATAVPTQDTHNMSDRLNNAKSQLLNGEWENLFNTVSEMRNIDPTYEPLTVDGLFYYALRNYGIVQIQQGNLETGLYYFAMAEKIAILDAEAGNWRRYAVNFIYAGSYYGIDWYKSSEAFLTVMQDSPYLMDASQITGRQRYVYTLEAIGDLMMQENDSAYYCAAVDQYEKAKNIISSERLLAKIQQAKDYCEVPPAVTDEPATPSATEAPTTPAPTTPP